MSGLEKHDEAACRGVSITIDMLFLFRRSILGSSALFEFTAEQVVGACEHRISNELTAACYVPSTSGRSSSFQFW